MAYRQRMELAITAAAGFLFKTDDEIEDINFIKSPSLKEYIKLLSIAVFSLLFLTNTSLNIFICACVIPISYYLKQVDSPFWKSLVPLPYLALLLSLNAIEDFSLVSILSTAFLFLICAFACVVEAVIFPEEVSLVKLGTRISLIFVFAGIIYFLKPLDSTTHILCLCIGYCLASSIIKLLTIRPEDVIPKEEYEKVEEMNIDDILKSELPAIKSMIQECILINKEVIRKILVFIVIVFHTLVNKKSDESQLEIAVNYVKAKVLKLADALDLEVVKEFIETFPDVYIPNLELEKRRFLGE